MKFLLLIILGYIILKKGISIIYDQIRTFTDYVEIIIAISFFAMIINSL